MATTYSINIYIHIYFFKKVSILPTPFSLHRGISEFLCTGFSTGLFTCKIYRRWHSGKQITVNPLVLCALWLLRLQTNRVCFVKNVYYNQTYPRIMC